MLNMKRNHFFLVSCAVALALGLSACGCSKAERGGVKHDALRIKLHELIDKQPAKIGIAVIFGNSDTLTVNSSDDYPLMSMFKLHEAIAVCHKIEAEKHSLDSVINIDKQEIDCNTWSPMLKEYSVNGFEISIGKLLEYLLIHSDNNASNILFDRIIDVRNTDSLIANILPERGFRLLYKESEMVTNHSLAYSNTASPLSYAMLVNKVFTDSVVSPSNQEFIKKTMALCLTGMERIAAVFSADKGVKFAHRTGSGYVNEHGEVVAVNDGGYVVLPDGKAYTIVILVKNYKGKQEDAEKVMAELSAEVYKYVKTLK